jgi:hypothetical protein
MIPNLSVNAEQGLPEQVVGGNDRGSVARSCRIPLGTRASTVIARLVDATVMVPLNASTRSRIPIVQKPCLWSLGRPALV